MIKSVLTLLQPRPGLRQRPGAEVRRGAAAGAADCLQAAVQQAGQGELQTGGELVSKLLLSIVFT